MKDNWFPCPSVELLVAPYGHLPMDAIGVLTVLRSQQWESRAGGIPVDIEDIYRAIKRRDDRGMTRKRFLKVWRLLEPLFPVVGDQRVDLQLAARRAREIDWSRDAYEDVYARDGRRCQYCGTSRGQMSIDHVIPRSHGGHDGADNLVVACRPCNSRKGARTPDQAGMQLLPPDSVN